MNFSQNSIWKTRVLVFWHSVDKGLGHLFESLARNPKQLKRLQNVLIAFLALWSLFSLSHLIWLPWRLDTIKSPLAAVLNPPSLYDQRASQAIDISGLLGSGFFSGSVGFYDNQPSLPLKAARSVDGIERQAKETGLALELTGIVASTEDGFGSAVIKSTSLEEVYAVGDLLPAAGKVSLSKVMPFQVVIDNNGVYELIKLYDFSNLGVGFVPPPRDISQAVATESSFAKSPRNRLLSEPEQADLAASYRKRLYDDPESLDQAVSVSPVRDQSGIIGYRVAPGLDRSVFESFGFKPGDIVTAVNGLELRDASNTVRLYQLLKDSTEARFDIIRNGDTVSINISLVNP